MAVLGLLGLLGVLDLDTSSMHRLGSLDTRAVACGDCCRSDLRWATVIVASASESASVAGLVDSTSCCSMDKGASGAVG